MTCKHGETSCVCTQCDIETIKAAEGESSRSPAGYAPCKTMRRLLISLYNTAYHAGHEDTVEGCFTNVLPVDMDSYHDDVVDEWVEDYLDSAENHAEAF